MSTVVAIHQPNFYPWLGFFDKWVRADVLVLLDDVQFPKTGGVWTNRCGILDRGQRTWFTASISRAFHGTRTIREIELASGRLWREKLMRRFEHSYAGTPNQEQVRYLLAADLMGTQSRLIDLNMDSLRRLGGALGLDERKLVLSSSLRVMETSTERLISIVKEVGGSSYLCGSGADGYQQDELFADSGITLQYQKFKHPTYPQSGVASFVPGLSILDGLCSVGVDGMSRLLRLGNR